MSATMNYSDPRAAFEAAIAAGRLSVDPAAENYAGNYMYMGNALCEQLRMQDGRSIRYPRAQFKHRDTREYLP